MTARAQARTRIASIALLGFALLTAPAVADDAKSTAPSYTIISRSPSLEIRFRGVSLEAAHTDAQQNRIALDLDTPVDSKLFDHLQQETSDWLDMAYGGYDNAVLHARRPAQFITAKENGGFRLTITAAPDSKLAHNDALMDNLQKIDAPFVLKGATEPQRASLFDRIGQFFGIK
jgi:hypothetical protein